MLVISAFTRRTSVNARHPICPFMCSYFGFMLSAAACGSRAVVSQWAPSAVSGCTVFPCKEQYCPHGPVNWLITSLMRMERPVTMATLSDGRVTSEPKSRTCLISRKWPQSRARFLNMKQWVKRGGWLTNGWIVTASDRCTVNLILYEKEITEQLLLVWKYPCVGIK